MAYSLTQFVLDCGIRATRVIGEHYFVPLAIGIVLLNVCLRLIQLYD